MTVSILPPSRKGVQSFPTKVALQQDHWNDYSFKTLYHLYHQEVGQPPTLIGPVKILRRGQSEQDDIQITEPFERLSPEFGSVGNSLDYYQRLNEIPAADRDEILSVLNDVVANPQLEQVFNQEKGWRVSLFRDNSDPDGFLADAGAIHSRSANELPDLHLSFKFHPGGWSSPVQLYFDAPGAIFYSGPKRKLGPSQREVLLPRRVMVLIGRNGSGKSTLLSRIARVAFASPSDRAWPQLMSVGVFDPPSVGFMRIIAVSYSAFENFSVPGLYETELEQIAADIEKGGGRYVYAGLRDVVAEVREQLATSRSRPRADNERSTVDAADRRPTTKLKSLEQLADEFVRLIGQITANGDSALFDAALRPVLADASFVDVAGSDWQAMLGSDPRSSFLGWSTGHKITLHAIASLVAHTTRKSLVLFDEPETHLHPPLIAGVLHALRLILEEKNAFAIVATHSPVILQETLSQHVRVIRRVGDQFEVMVPSRQTFGENVGTLTHDTFGLTASSTDFHEILDLLVQAHTSVEQVNEHFTPPLSGQALAYVLAGLARKARQ
ncbi:AAA family ATPase [Rhizobium skierniewicense]|uniref:AAA family ATPase n=1 Tax=Rhizobium skierniewicense TaxID=984260 RepID=UPI00157221A2|nr:AAA family ATPase [Rhizobium skierniewicense]NTF34124.1 ATP-binding protein [Rhizobium skierniewicense]